MNKFTTAVKAFIADEDGVTAIEYGLMAAGLAAGLGVAVGSLTTGLGTAFAALAQSIVDAMK